MSKITIQNISRVKPEMPVFEIHFSVVDAEPTWIGGRFTIEIKPEWTIKQIEKEVEGYWDTFTK
jgi:hypothetical protein